jgi:hypothetical protein
LDHALLLSDQDTQLIATLRAISECKLYLYRQANPSTEVVARALFDEARHKFGPVVERVRVWEPPGSTPSTRSLASLTMTVAQVHSSPAPQMEGH